MKELLFLPSVMLGVMMSFLMPIWPGAFQRYPGEERTYKIKLSYYFE